MRPDGWGARLASWIRRIGRGPSLSMTRPTTIDVRPSTGTQARDLPHGHYQDHPGHGCTPQRVISIFREAENGSPASQCDLFDDLIENDCTLRNLFDQRNQSVAGKPHGVQAGGSSDDDALIARVLGEAFKRLPMTEVFEHQLKFNYYGWAASEIDWGEMEFEGRSWVVPVWFANVPARRFRIDPRADRLLLVTDANPQGEQLKPGRWLVTRGRGPSLARASLMRSAAWPALWKRFSTRDWVVFSEMFGIPLVQATYDDLEGGGGGTDTDSRAVAEEIVRRFGSSGGAVTPKSIEVKIHEAARTVDSSGTHGNLIKFANSEMAKLINGATLVNDSDGSGGASYALGEVHASVRWDNVTSDAGRIEEAMRTQVFFPFLRFNGMEHAHAAELKIQVVRDLSPKVRLECADIALNRLGMPISQSQIRQDASFREPLNPSDAAPGMAAAESTRGMPS